MDRNPKIKISEFARITGISRDNLIYYDKIGLLRAEYRGENNYRYYTYRELGLAFMIKGLRSIGVSIKEIKNYHNKRTPEKMLRLFDKKERDIKKEISRLKEIQGTMQLYSNLVRTLDEYDAEHVEIKKLPETKIFVGPFVKPPKSYEEASTDFLEFSANAGMDLSYPFGVIVSQHSLLQNDYSVQRCYFLVPRQGNAVRPGGTYLVGHLFGGYGEAAPLYKRLVAYAAEHNLVICGDAYEEYPLNEMTSENDNEYLIRVMIPIQLKD